MISISVQYERTSIIAQVRPSAALSLLALSVDPIAKRRPTKVGIDLTLLSSHENYRPVYSVPVPLVDPTEKIRESLFVDELLLFYKDHVRRTEFDAPLFRCLVAIPLFFFIRMNT